MKKKHSKVSYINPMLDNNSRNDSANIHSVMDDHEIAVKD